MVAGQARKSGKWRKRIVYLIGAAGLYLLLCFVLAYRYVHPSGSTPQRPPNAEEITIAGPYGPIPAWSSPGLETGKPKSETVYVLCHGYGGNRESWAQTMEDLEAKGFEVVVPEMPGHGASTDRTVGFGEKESQVVIAAARWAVQRYEGSNQVPKVVAVGVSMGGAACWLASGKEPGLFSAIVTEGAYARLDEASDRWFDMLLPGGHVVLAPVRWFAEAMSGIRTDSIVPVDAAAKWKGRPALVIHCTQDRLMGDSHAKRLAEASGAELWEVPTASHACGYSEAREAYLARLLAFAER